MDRQPGDLAAQVPQGDVHGADRAQGRVAMLGPHGLPQTLAIERVLAEDERLQVVDQTLRVEMRAAHGRPEEGVALQALLRPHGDEPELALAAEAPGVAAVGGGRNPRPREEGDGQIHDLHQRLQCITVAGFADPGGSMMKYRALGRTGIEVSALGFGCGDVGGLIVRGTPVERTRAVARAVELGINYFDTASSYGNGVSEEHLGGVLRELDLDVYVGTKVRLRPEDLGDIRGAVIRSCEASLRRL